MQRKSLKLGTAAQHLVPVLVRRADVVRVKRQLEAVEMDKVRAPRPGEVDANERNVAQTRESVIEYHDGRSVRREIEILHGAIVLKMV